ncbi:protein kinase [Streptomyces virginiae]|uniref:serine/threonine-protein kinase n=1 Tax=Streptomyces virginiae TaxID=1961 RepID=UPI0022510503|nr:serine/threonine-protein kinase [Streptomyces virginiae]MCX4720021.1 protein kinase [Streptomyces virginiae]
MSSDMRRHAGRYELGTLIGKGGMGQVWDGYDPELGRPVAVKLIRPEQSGSDTGAKERVARFRREARIMARLNHPGVPQIYDVVPDPAGSGRLYIIMQRVYGRTLKEICRDYTPLPVAWAVCVAAHIASVLALTHAVPVVHRDLKPDNVMVTDEGSAMVLDFGIATLLDGEHTRLTPTNRPIGTPSYMSPEQAGSGEVTPRSDYYSLGCLLYELLTGRPPFTAANTWALLYHHVHEQPLPPRDLRPDIGHEVDRLVLDLLAKDPEDRPRSAYEVYHRLAPFFPEGQQASGDVWPLALGKIASPSPPTAPAALLATQAPQSGAADRLVHAEALFQEQEYGRALPLYQGLADDWGAAGATGGSEALRCLSRAAYCLMKMGEVAEALASFEAVLKNAGAANLTQTDPMMLSNRRHYGLLLHSANRLPQAFEVLVDLYRDMTAAGQTDPREVARVRDALNRIRRQFRGSGDQ